MAVTVAELRAYLETLDPTMRLAYHAHSGGYSGEQCTRELRQMEIKDWEIVQAKIGEIDNGEIYTTEWGASPEGMEPWLLLDWDWS